MQLPVRGDRGGSCCRDPLPGLVPTDGRGGGGRGRQLGAELDRDLLLHLQRRLGSWSAGPAAAGRTGRGSRLSLVGGAEQVEVGGAGGSGGHDRVLLEGSACGEAGRAEDAWEGAGGHRAWSPASNTA